MSEDTSLLAGRASKAPNEKSQTAPLVYESPRVEVDTIDATATIPAEVASVLDDLMGQAIVTPTADVPTLAVTGPGGLHRCPVSITPSRRRGSRRSGPSMSLCPVRGLLPSESVRRPERVRRGDMGPAVRHRCRRHRDPVPHSWVFMDGRPVGCEPFVPAASSVSAGSKSFLRLTFSGERNRVIRICGAQAAFGGVSVPAGKSIVAALKAEAIRLFAHGDSWPGGSDDGGWPLAPETFSRQCWVGR